jgi:hypothetical protein
MVEKREKHFQSRLILVGRFSEICGYVTGLQKALHLLISGYTEALFMVLFTVVRVFGF